MTTFKIIRMFEDDDLPPLIVKRGLTLEEARAHCHDPQTSSRTAKGPQAELYTSLMGRWFDGYTEE